MPGWPCCASWLVRLGSPRAVASAELGDLGRLGTHSAPGYNGDCCIGGGQDPSRLSRHVSCVSIKIELCWVTVSAGGNPGSGSLGRLRRERRRIWGVSEGWASAVEVVGELIVRTRVRPCGNTVEFKGGRSSTLVALC
jgi:hypothetical protein